MTPTQRIATEAIRQAATHPSDDMDATHQRVADATNYDTHTVRAALSGTHGVTAMEPINKSNLPTDPADLVGPMGRAWRLDMQAISAQDPSGPPASVTVASWLVHAPFAHPLFPTYQVACIHLRDAPGLQPAKIMLAGATHEVIVLALHPEQRLRLDVMPQPLQPVNFIGQFVAADDDAAATCIRHSVSEIVQGALSPDTEHSSAWVQRYSDSNVRRLHPQANHNQANQI
jgi:hypothetical protein